LLLMYCHVLDVLIKPRCVIQVNITMADGESLGLMIRGGREFGLGIYISGVDRLSKADQAGIDVSTGFV